MEVHTNGRVLDALTWREQDILALLAERHTNREIAQNLGLELSTVKWHNHGIYDKLGVSNRRDAATRAEELAQRQAGSSTLLRSKPPGPRAGPCRWRKPSPTRLTKSRRKRHCDGDGLDVP